MARARAAGLAEMLVVGGVDESRGHRRALAVAERFGFPATAGVHPHEARLASEAVYDELRGLAREGRIVAIGGRSAPLTGVATTASSPVATVARC